MSINLSGIASAVGLSMEDSEMVSELVNVLNANAGKHELRRRYYDDKVRPPERGMKVPDEYKGMNCFNGWAAKAVNMLAERSVLDSFTFSDEEPPGFAECVRGNNLPLLYQMAMPSNLTDGVGFWTVDAGADGEPAALVGYRDATTAAGLWDYRRQRLRAGLSIADYARFGKSQIYIPSLVILYKSGGYVFLYRSDRTHWAADYVPHPMGVPPMVPMVYRKSGRRPFGTSRISPAVMTYVDAMMAEIRDMAVQSDYFSIPMRYALGLSQTQYDAMAQNLIGVYRADVLLATNNEDGGRPEVGQLQGADMTPHIAVMDKLANLMASETALPVATFGVAGNGYTSSDALRASTDDLVVLAKSVNAANGMSMADVAKMMLAVIGGKPISALDENERSVSVHFADPAMPSAAASADSAIKIVSAVPSYAGSDVFWEKLGFDDDQRRRIKAQTKEGENKQAIMSLLTGAGATDDYAQAAGQLR